MITVLASALAALFLVTGGDAFHVAPKIRNRQRLTHQKTSISSFKLASESNRNHVENNDNNLLPSATAESNAASLSRRDAIAGSTQAAGAALASCLLLATRASADDDDAPPHPVLTPQLPSSQRTIVMTGANSGIGLEACKRLAVDSDTTLILACRSLAKAQDAIQHIQQKQTSTAAKLIPAECNLANLQSIQTFANEVLPQALVGYQKNIDVLCLNAGLARNTAANDCARTDDGFELTVGTNHFGHFYLNHLLLSSQRINPQTGKIVVTASSVHDPDSPGGAQGFPATLGELNGMVEYGKDFEMVDGQPFNADKAYKDSKLCNVFFTRELQRRLDVSDSYNGIIVNAFTPGLIVGTGLFRDQNPLFTKLFDFAATDLIKVGETPSWGGGALTYMVNNVDTKGLYYYAPPGSSKYGDAAFGKQFGPTAVSKEAQDDAKGKRFWELTEQLLDIKTVI